MTPKQRIHFFTDLWRPACKVMGWAASDDAFRYAKLSEWLGRTLTTTKEGFSNKDFDKVKQECLAIIQPANVNAQIRQIEQEDKRLRYACRAAAPEPYLRSILADRFGGRALDELNHSELVMLRNTLAARANSLKRKAKQASTRNEEPATVEDDNCPF